MPSLSTSQVYPPNLQLQVGCSIIWTLVSGWGGKTVTLFPDEEAEGLRSEPGGEQPALPGATTDTPHPPDQPRTLCWWLASVPIESSP